MKSYKLAVVVGRFQPLHCGHEELIKQALLKAEKVLILVGSSQESRTVKNPFNFHERRDMIESTFVDDVHRLSIVPLMDFDTNEEWINNVEITINLKHAYDSEICVFVCDKDQSTLDSNNILRSLPYTVFPVIQWLNYSATSVRQSLFNGENPKDLVHLPKHVQAYLAKRWLYVNNEINKASLEEQSKPKKWYKSGIIGTVVDLVTTVALFVFCF
jgi:bifunctional NMN adenylyltransferase/nudix hydrolase